jgi:hypothetical protein
MFATGMFAASVRGCGVGRSMGRGVGASVRVAGVPGGWAMSSIGGITASAVSTASDIPASSTTAEAMLTPTVTIAPVRPWAYAQEDSVIEIARPIKAAGRAAVG